MTGISIGVLARWARRRKKRVAVMGCVACVVACLVLYGWWPPSRPALGLAATFVSGPRNTDGTVDYVEATNLAYYEPDWRENAGSSTGSLLGSAVLRQRLISGREWGERTAQTFQPWGFPPFVGYGRREALASLLDRSWKAGEKQHVEEWLNANAEVLSFIEGSTEADQLHLPLVAAVNKRVCPGDPPQPREHPILMYARVPALDRLDEIAECLAIRATRAGDSATPKNHWRDVRTCYRLGRLVGQCPTWGAYFLSDLITQTAFRAHSCLLAEGRLDGLEDEVCRDLSALPRIRRAWERVGIDVRFHGLDTAMLFYRGVSLESFCERVDDSVPSHGDDRYHVDWNRSLGEFNRWCDQAVTVWKCESLAEFSRKRAALMGRLRQEGVLLRDPPSVWFWVRLGRFGRARCTRILLAFLATEIANCRPPLEELRGDAIVRLGQLAAKVKRFRATKGKFPSSLREGARDLGREALVDPFSGKPFLLRSARDVCVLRSVGPDGVPEKPVAAGVKECDDIVVRLRWRPRATGEMRQ